MPKHSEIRLTVCEELATALRGLNRLSELMSRYLGPDIGRTWIVLSGRDITIGGVRLRDVRKLASRYARVDRILRRHGMKPVELGLGVELIPEVAGYGEGWLQQLGYTRTKDSKLVMAVPTCDETARRLQGPLLWLLAMAKAARVKFEFLPGEIHLDSPVSDFKVPFAREIVKIGRFCEGDFTPGPRVLGAAECLLWAGAPGVLKSPLRFSRRMEQAATTGDWRQANKAYELEDFRTRIRVDPDSGRAKGGFTEVYEGVEDEILGDDFGYA